MISLAPRYVEEMGNVRNGFDSVSLRFIYSSLHGVLPNGKTLPFIPKDHDAVLEKSTMGVVMVPAYWIIPPTGDPSLTIVEPVFDHPPTGGPGDWCRMSDGSIAQDMGILDGLTLFPTTPVRKRIFIRPDNRVILGGNTDNRRIVNRTLNTSFIHETEIDDTTIPTIYHRGKMDIVSVEPLFASGCGDVRLDYHLHHCPETEIWTYHRQKMRWDGGKFVLTSDNQTRSRNVSVRFNINTVDGPQSFTAW